MRHGYSTYKGGLPDYYEVLGISRTDGTDKVKKAYYAKAKLWHPDRNPYHKEEVETMFKLIGEAYEVLKESHSRAAFDLDLRNYESIVLRNGVKKPQYPQVPPKNKPQSNGVAPNFCKDNVRNSQAFGATPKYKAEGMPRSASYSSKPGHTKPNKPDYVIHKLKLTLEELYTGITKKMKITRNWLDGSTTQELLMVEVNPGFTKGKKVTIKNKGDQLQDKVFQDIIFEIEPKPHPVFYFDGDDLTVDIELSIADSLCGFSKDIPHLSGMSLLYECTKCTPNGYIARVPGVGMPNPTNPETLSDLFLNFKVTLPTELTQRQIDIVRSAFV